MEIKKTADNKRTFVQFVFAYWQVVVVNSGYRVYKLVRKTSCSQTQRKESY